MTWSWSLNWGVVTPRILIGTCPMALEDLRRIHTETGATAVLSLQHDECLAYWGIDYRRMSRTAAGLGLHLVRTPMRDFNIVDQRRRLPDAVTGLSRLQSLGHLAYVHCTAGLGRAPLTVLTYLVLVERRDPEEAIRMILAARPGAVPSWEAFHGCRRDLVKRHRRAIERRAYTLYRQGHGAGADQDWRQAEVQVLSEVLGGEQDER